MKQFTEKEAENFLEKNKFSVAKRMSISKQNKLEEVTKRIPFPWVMKVSSKKIMHKAKVGGVIINIDSLEESKKAFQKLSKVAGFEEIMIQENISGKEIVVGIKKTPEFSHVLMFGKGGQKLEQEKKVVFRIFPLKEKEITEMINEIFPKLNKEDVLNKIIDKIQKLIKKYPNITELDINPLIVNDKEAKIADARIVFN